MDFFGQLKRLITPGGLVCPQCEKPMEGHDEGSCARRMSRRYFFAVSAGAVAAAAASQIVPLGLADADRLVVGELGVKVNHGNTFLTSEMITIEMLMILKGNLGFDKIIKRHHDLEYV